MTPQAGGSLMAAWVAAVLAMRPSSRVFGGKASQWLAAFVGINIVFLFSLPLGSGGHLMGIAVGAAYGRLWRTGARQDVEQTT